MIDFLKGTVTPKDWIAMSGILAAAAAIAVGFYFVVYQRQLEQIKIIEANNLVVKDDLAKSQDVQKNIAALEAETLDIENTVKEFEKRLPLEREIIPLIRQIEVMAEEENVDIDIAAMNRQTQSNKEIIPYKVQARGGYHNIGAFINRIETFERFFKVDELTVRDFTAGIAKADFVLNTYRFIQQPAAPVAAATAGTTP